MEIGFETEPGHIPDKSLQTLEAINHVFYEDTEIPSEILYRQISKNDLSKFDTLITSYNDSNSDPSEDDIILLHNKIPAAFTSQLIEFTHQNTPTPAPTKALDTSILNNLNDSFDNTTGLPRFKLKRIHETFSQLFPDLPLIADDAERILLHTYQLIDFTHALLIKQHILNLALNNPIITLSSLTGFQVPYYSADYANEFDCFGNFTTSQTTYLNYCTQIAISTNYTFKIIASQRIAAELH